MFRAALLLFLSGAIGNFIDRVIEGEVVDFMHLHYQDALHWATFNVADVYITAGFVLLLVDSFRGRKRRVSPEKVPEPS
jgi:signal peptidase II